MEFHETGLLRFKQKADMGIVHPLHKSTVGGRKDQDLVIVGNNNPITSSAASDLNIKGDSKAIIRGNEGVNIMGRTVEFKMGGDIELRAENTIVLNGSVMFNATRIPSSTDLTFNDGLERYKLCMCEDGTLFRVLVKFPNMGCQISDNPCGKAH
ncbi:hypothetical protein GOODEAATRI_018097 [Goodea atripinnis]|uniref:Beta-sarcoglycan n=1 Tax=Goodea atripinnis TaxID=208336 RepID=A0ABV0NBH5_9TELE